MASFGNVHGKDDKFRELIKEYGRDRVVGALKLQKSASEAQVIEALNERLLTRFRNKKNWKGKGGDDKSDEDAAPAAAPRWPVLLGGEDDAAELEKYKSCSSHASYIGGALKEDGVFLVATSSKSHAPAIYGAALLAMPQAILDDKGTVDVIIMASVTSHRSKRLVFPSGEIEKPELKKLRTSTVDVQVAWPTIGLLVKGVGGMTHVLE
ncbi:hypothetical protein TSOC_000358 [Tetrabaena socialis]|uniref:Uncharacterized protein n=1 Tax=Tetrabaena socialis TaxID=47790 RepID=A0A2J8AJH4_9CHLO|nr:hypothetical protein TSOC_000358 [Tetrabaena socialis]|eukprot:PNH12664.1 hypothetical protein TSOC_000358 [Tetrabaena socialis]